MKRRLSVCSLILLTAQCIALGAQAQNALSFENLNREVVDFPDGCGAAIQDVGRFVNFYEASIQAIAAKRGGEVDEVVNLFAVSALRKAMSDQFPGNSDESPIDKLIIGQLCQFRSVRTAQMAPGSTQRAVITSADEDLHQHLSKISVPLYRDARDLMENAVASRKRAKSRAEYMAARQGNVRRARELGQEKVKELINRK